MNAQVENEHKEVVAWRFKTLTDAGADNHSAQIVSERLDVSLHEAVELLNHNCSPELMIAILF